MFWFSKILSHILKQKIKVTKIIRSYSFNSRFVVIRATPEDYSNILDLFRDTYFMKEPCLVGIGLAGKRNIFYENILLEGLSEGMSLIAKCRTNGSLAGAIINTSICEWDTELIMQKASCCNCEKMKKLVEFYSYVTEEPKLWSKTYERKIFEIAYLTTASNFVGMGVGKNLIKKSLELGKDLSYNVIRVDATSEYTARICEAHKMQLIWELPYKDYKGPDGKQLIIPPKPHTHVKVYVHYPHAEKPCSS